MATELIDTILAREAPKLNIDVVQVDKSLQALLNAKPGQESDVDVINYLNENFSTVESLDNVDAIILQLDS
jgi:hypothetical protein